MAVQKSQPTKGKKKVKSLQDKVRKKIHLNKQDRRKVVKLKKQEKTNAILKERVSNNLAQLGIVSDKDELEGTPSANKRVSFADALEECKLFNKNALINAKPSTASPGRSILSTPLSKAKAKAKPTTVNGVQPENKEEKNSSVKKVLGLKQKTISKESKLKVTKKVKEQLMEMPRKERKAFVLELRKKQKPNVELVEQCKALWEIARSGKGKQEEKDAAITQLVGVVKNKAKELIYSHEMSRVFQFLLKLGREGIVAMLFNELVSELVRMSKSPYSRFFVKRLLKYGTREQRQIIINAFHGHAVRMLNNIFAADILESVFNEYASVEQRFNIVCEFYGKEFVMFKTEGAKTLADLIAKEPEKKPLIAKHLEEAIIDKCTQKITLRHSLVHKLMLDLMTIGNGEQKKGLLEAIKDQIPEIVHTPCGARVAMHCVWLADAKDRKLIVKNFKDLSVKAALEKHGQKVLWTIFDQVDDTTLINKYITSEIANNVGTVIKDRWGCLCLEYMVHPRDGRSMDWNVIKELAQGDNNPTSKKSKKDRYSEIFQKLASPLITFITANMEEMFYGDLAAITCHLVRKIFELPIALDLYDRQISAEDRIAAYKAIAKLCVEEFVPMNPERFHMVEHKHSSYVMGQLLRQDTKLPEDQRLSTQIIETVPAENLQSWVGCNKGCFILLRMIENGGSSMKEKVRAAMDMRRLNGYTFVGAKLLREALTGVKENADENSAITDHGDGTEDEDMDDE